MIDFIRATVKNKPVEAWENNTLLDFNYRVSSKTGLLSPKKIANYSKLTYSISYFQEHETKCSIEGSLHKFKNRAGVNYDRFTFVELIQVIAELKNTFEINPNETVLRSFEFGVNLCLQYPPDKIIKAAISHKKQPPQQINKFNRNLGIQFVHNEYIIKLYDKAKQSGFKGRNILRFEIQVKRLRMLHKYEINTLSDLTNRDKVEPLISELLKVANEIIFYDFWINKEPLTPKELINWNEFGNPKQWELFNKSQTYKAKERFKKLSNKLKATDYNKQLYNWVGYEWFEIFKVQQGDLFTPINNTAVKPQQKGDLFTKDLKQLEAEKRRPFHKTLETAEQNKKATFSHFICSANSLPKGNDKNIIIEPLLFEVNQVQTIKRFCKTCSRDISHQKNKSLYCSEKYFGKDGKRCRNVEANKQRTIRNNIKKNTKEP